MTECVISHRGLVDSQAWAYADDSFAFDDTEFTVPLTGKNNNNNNNNKDVPSSGSQNRQHTRRRNSLGCTGDDSSTSGRSHGRSYLRETRSGARRSASRESIDKAIGRKIGTDPQQAVEVDKFGVPVQSGAQKIFSSDRRRSMGDFGSSSDFSDGNEFADAKVQPPNFKTTVFDSEGDDDGFGAVKIAKASTNFFRDSMNRNRAVRRQTIGNNSDHSEKGTSWRPKLDHQVEIGVTRSPRSTRRYSLASARQSQADADHGEGNIDDKATTKSSYGYGEEAKATTTNDNGYNVDSNPTPSSDRAKGRGGRSRRRSSMPYNLACSTDDAVSESGTEQFKTQYHLDKRRPRSKSPVSTRRHSLGMDRSERNSDNRRPRSRSPVSTRRYSLGYDHNERNDEKRRSRSKSPVSTTRRYSLSSDRSERHDEKGRPRSRSPVSTRRYSLGTDRSERNKTITTKDYGYNADSNPTPSSDRAKGRERRFGRRLSTPYNLGSSTHSDNGGRERGNQNRLGDFFKNDNKLAGGQRSEEFGDQTVFTAPTALNFESDGSSVANRSCYSVPASGDVRKQKFASLPSRRHRYKTSSPTDGSLEDYTVKMKDGTDENHSVGSPSLRRRDRRKSTDNHGSTERSGPPSGRRGSSVDGSNHSTARRHASRHRSGSPSSRRGTRGSSVDGSNHSSRGHGSRERSRSPSSRRGTRSSAMDGSNHSAVGSVRRHGSPSRSGSPSGRHGTRDLSVDGSNHSSRRHRSRERSRSPSSRRDRHGLSGDSSTHSAGRNYCSEEKIKSPSGRRGRRGTSIDGSDHSCGQSLSSRDGSRSPPERRRRGGPRGLRISSPGAEDGSRQDGGASKRSGSPRRGLRRRGSLGPEDESAYGLRRTERTSPTRMSGRRSSLGGAGVPDPTRRFPERSGSPRHSGYSRRKSAVSSIPTKEFAQLGLQWT